MNSRNKLKILLLNVVILLGLLAGMEFLSMIALDVMQLNRDKKLDERINLLNYKNNEWATTYFKEKVENVSQYQSYYEWKKRPFEGETINVDSFGHRMSKEYPPIQGWKKPLAIFLGGSTMFGVGSRDHETIPSQFVKLSNGRYKAINMGEGAFSAFQSYLYFQIQMSKGTERPDVVVSYDGVNNSGFGRGHFEHPRENQMQRILKGADGGKYRFLNHTRSFINSFKVKKGKEANSTNSTIGQKKAAIELLESWLLMKYLCDRIGAKFICILQPVAFRGMPDLAHNPKLREERSAYYDYYRYVHEFLKMEKYAMLQNHFVDMSAAFDHVPLVYIDFCHTSPNGNSIIANLILEQVSHRFSALPADN